MSSLKEKQKRCERIQETLEKCHKIRIAPCDQIHYMWKQCVLDLSENSLNRNFVQKTK